jgi:hypothetical protein
MGNQTRVRKDRQLLLARHMEQQSSEHQGML